MLTAERLRALLHYDPKTGVFVRLIPRDRFPAGSIAGSYSPDGYIQISVDNHTYMAHRLAWLFVSGEWPADQVDHINGKRDDNRFANLREATQSQNRGNVSMNSRNTSGLRGVHFDKRRQRWHAQISINRKKRHLGDFDTAEAAHEAYMAVARQHWGSFCREK